MGGGAPAGFWTRSAGGHIARPEKPLPQWNKGLFPAECGGKLFPMRRWILPWICAGRLLWTGAGRADTFSGADWIVRFNLPDQTTSIQSIGPDEFVIRDAFLARINALGNNDWACLATYTFSGGSAAVGAAGPILAAVSNALERGARIGFVVDYGVNVSSNYWPGVSLASLAMRAANPLELVRAPASSGIMHHKVGVFWYRAAGEGWVLSASWNFTGGASSQQWNILTEICNGALAAAYSNEMRELLSGRFHPNPAKSHLHDASRFRLAQAERDGWVRFAPYPESKVGGTNAMTDIVAAINAAQDEIFFALNKLTRMPVAEALIRACNRGVIVHGVIPKSDCSQPGDESYEVYQFLLTSTNYTTRNRVRLYEAYYNAARTRYDNGSRDLVHTKYMIVDPRGPAPLVIHGSANWTAGALLLTSSNDENIQFLPQRGIAEAFLAQFAAMTDGLRPWCALRAENNDLWLDYWLPDDWPRELVWTADLRPPAAWTNRVQLLPAVRGTNSLRVPAGDSQRFFRLQAVP